VAGGLLVDDFGTTVIDSEDITTACQMTFRETEPVSISRNEYLGQHIRQHIGWRAYALATRRPRNVLAREYQICAGTWRTRKNMSKTSKIPAKEDAPAWLSCAIDYVATLPALLQARIVFQTSAYGFTPETDPIICALACLPKAYRQKINLNPCMVREKAVELTGRPSIQSAIQEALKARAEHSSFIQWLETDLERTISENRLGEVEELKDAIQSQRQTRNRWRERLAILQDLSPCSQSSSP